VIYLTRRFNVEQNEFGGVIGLQLKMSHFDYLYSSLQLPPSGTVTLIRKDGWGIFRFPLVDSFFATNLLDSKVFQRMLAEQRGSFSDVVSPYDGYTRVGGFKLNDRFPVVSVVTVTENSILASWWEKALNLIIMVVFGGLIIILLGIIALRQVYQSERALTISEHDPLTGLWNRRAFSDRLDEEWSRAKRWRESLALLYLDIDYFKNYNDSYGHQRGDECLKRVSLAIQDSVRRSGEMVVRLGGEEFAVLLPLSSGEQAKLLADKIRARVEGLEIPHSKSLISDFVTLSIGVSSMIPDDQALAEDLVEQADKALYQAKESGRNRVEEYQPEA
jgi:diguanylate cyclase (GGDEF)-like protein